MKTRGNGNIQTGSPLGYEVQKSLLELLQTEDTLIKQLNTAQHAYVVASKTSTRITEYKRDLDVLTVKVDDAREEIKRYFLNVLGIQVVGMRPQEKSTVSKAYMEREKMINSLYEDR